MPNLPSGTVTFVFSDVEGSTALLKQLGDEGYTKVLATHRRLVRESFGKHDGHEIDTQGDAFFYSFTRARQAVAAAVAVQRAHAEEEWPEGASVQVRLGMHTGEPAVGDEGYTGLDVVLASRIASCGRGGQVLLSDATRAIVSGALPEGVELRALGECQLRDIDRPEPLHELRIEGVTPPSEPMPLATPAHPDGSVVSRALAGMPAWIRDATSGSGPPGDGAGEAIERRVLAEVRRALGPRAEPGPRRSPPPRRSSATARPSAADEIAKLRSLRDSGALTEEQYAKAVDRAIEGDGR